MLIDVPTRDSFVCNGTSPDRGTGDVKKHVERFDFRAVGARSFSMT
jgi:hypothetical protein